jgi:hypothetical protein
MTPYPCRCRGECWCRVPGRPWRVLSTGELVTIAELAPGVYGYVVVPEPEPAQESRP